MTNLNLLGHDDFIHFEDLSINCFYDLVTSSLPSFDVKYVLHIESKDYSGIGYSEWVVFDVTSSNLFTAV